MDALTFLNPVLLWGLGLASIPIIIHLLFRRRFKIVDWAPMRYLKLTIQRNRRRIQLEQLLLLLLRVALILLLFFLVARPVAHLTGMADWLGAGSRASKVLVLDDSLSMGLTVGDHVVFDRAIELATQMIRDLRSQDRFTLVLASQPKRPLLHEVSQVDEEQTVQMLRRLKPSDAFVSWSPVLKAVDEVVASSTYPTREVTILTDLRRTGWEQDLKELAERWNTTGVQLRIFNLGGGDARQVSLESLEAQDPVTLVGVPSRWEAVVHNASDQALEHLEATVLVDGKPNQLVLPALPPNQRTRVPLMATFQEPGLHHFSLRLPADELPGDNQRWNVVNVRERLHLMLVDGEPASEPFGGEVDFLALALSAGLGEASGFQIEMLTDADFAGLGRAEPDLMVLANVASILPPQARRLRALVEAGMGLVIFVGDQVDPDNYNQTLCSEDIRLLPAQLESISDEPATGLVLEANAPSALDALRQLNPAVLERIKTNKYYRVRLPTNPDEGVRVLARWNDADASPAAVERPAGRGRVLLWTVTADKAWGDWPTQPSYVLAMREGAKALARSDQAREVTAGEILRRVLPADAKIRAPVIEVPGADEPVPLSIDDTTAAEGTSPPHSDSSPSLTYSDTRRAGMYRLNWQAEPGGPGADVVAVNPDARESDLMALSTDDLRSKWGELPVEIITVGAGDVRLTTRGDEIWRPLAMCLLGLVAVEACFATWAGRQR